MLTFIKGTMMIEITKINNRKQKANICDIVLHSLPKWFEVESSIANYIEDTQSLPFWVAFDEGVPIGFVSLKKHNTFTSEICVMGILESYHRKGIGKMFLENVEYYCKENKQVFLTVKTLDETSGSKSYAKTREFYLSMGFAPLEIFPLFWNEENPCLFMAKYLGNNEVSMSR